MTWYALTTAPRKEFATLARLQRRDVEVFLPTEFREIRRGKRAGHHFEVPKLPGYIFVSQCDPFQVQHEHWEWIRGVLGVDGRPAQIPHQRLELWARQSAAPLIHSKEIVPGRQAELVTPGCEHVVVDVLSVKGKAATVLMWLFGSKREVEVQVKHLIAA